MHKFKLHDPVIIKHGPYTGTPATIIELQKGLVYKLELSNGKIVYFSEISLNKPLDHDH